MSVPQIRTKPLQPMLTRLRPLSQSLKRPSASCAEPLPAASSKAASIPQMRRMRTELREPPRADSLKRTLRDPAANLIDLTADHAQYDP
jgi:hypothetical protein